jgi:hypothetical protein
MSVVTVWFLRAALLASTLISHKGHHGHKGKPTGFTLVSFASFVVIRRRDKAPRPIESLV